MIPAFVKQLFYIAEQRSWAYVARQTAIAYRKVLSLRSGLVDVIPAMRTSIRNAYQREAYSRLRDDGFSFHQARRWSSYGTETTRLKVQSMRLKIAELATGATAAKIRQKGLDTSIFNVNRYYDEMYAKVKEGITSSPLTTEQILDY